jgi:single-strand DNA-binding protein
VTVWDRQAENCAEFLRKGSGVLVEGFLKTDSWEDKQTGEKKSKLGVQAITVQFLDKPGGGEGGGSHGGGRRDRDEAPTTSRGGSRGRDAAPPPARRGAPMPPAAGGGGYQDEDEVKF